jgi:hypothetical protein
MGEGRLHVVFGPAQAGSSLRNWPGGCRGPGGVPGPARQAGWGTDWRAAGRAGTPREKEKWSWVLLTRR